MAPVPPKPTPDDNLELIDLPPEGTPWATVAVQGQVQSAPDAPQGRAMPAPEAASLEQLLGLAAPGSGSPELFVNHPQDALPMLELQDTNYAVPSTAPMPRPQVQARPPQPQLAPAEEVPWAADADDVVQEATLVDADDVEGVAPATAAVAATVGATAPVAAAPGAAVAAPPTAEITPSTLGFAEKTPVSLEVPSMGQPSVATPAAPVPAGQRDASPPAAVNAARARPGWRRHTAALAAGAAACCVAAAATWLWQHQQHAVVAEAPAVHPVAVGPRPPPVAAMRRSDPPTGATPAAAVVPLPEPELTPLSLKNVDSLDYASLKAGVAALAGSTEPETEALRQWGQFRLAEAFGEPAPIVGHPPAAHRNRRATRPVPLAQVAQAAIQALAARPEASLLALRGLSPAAKRLPQGAWLGLWAAGRARGPTFKPLPAQVRALDKLVEIYPQMVDARVLRAQWTLAGAKGDAAQVAAAAQAAQRAGDADTQARFLSLLVDAEAWRQIDAALGPAQQDDTPTTRRALAKAAPRHQDLLWRLRVHRRVRMGDFEAAQQLAAQRAHAEPKHAAAQQEEVRLADVIAIKRQPGDTKATATGPEAEMLQASRALFEAVLQGDADAANAPVKQMLGLASRLPAPWHKFAEAERRGDWQAAGHTLDGLLWHDPTVGDPVDDMLQLIALTHRAGDVDVAAAEADNLIAHLPQDDRPPTLMAQLAHAAHQDDAQVRWRKALLQRHPHDRSHTLALAMALIDAGRAPEALETLKALATADPEARDAEFLYVQGRALGLQNPVAARTVLQASAKAKPQVKTYVLMADLAQERGKLDEAATALRDAMALAPNDLSLKLRQVRLLLPQGGRKEAVTILKGILEADPKAGEAAETLADVLQEEGELAPAAAMYAQALTTLGPRAPLLMKLALLQLHGLHDLQAAEQSLHKAVTIDPKAPEPHYYLGLALHDKGEDREAREQLQAYLSLAPQGPFVTECKEVLRSL